MPIWWNISFSSPFITTNGVHQGGVLSSILFTIYLDYLLTRLKGLGYGCHWDGFVGAVCYADDVALLPSALMHYVTNFASTFNANKTQLICFRTQHSHSSSVVYNLSSLMWSHLGHHLSFDLRFHWHIVHSTRHLVKRANLTLITFATADTLVKFCLYVLQYYCLFLYGCALWNVSSPALCSIEVAFNNILRCIWHLPCSYNICILYLTACLPSLFNTTANRSLLMLNSAKSPVQ